MGIRDRIKKPTDIIAVDAVVLLAFGDPGVGKTTLAQTAERPLTLDFDGGSYRARNRQDVLPIAAWEEVDDLLRDEEALADYSTLVVDTVGRALDVLGQDIVRKNPKHGSPASGLSLQGFGALKARFALFVASLRRAGKDLVLLAHDREEKDGDTRIVRPDIQGSSYGEVMKLADLVGYMHIRGGQRTMAWNPTENWVAKNPCGWPSFVAVPDTAKAPSYLGTLLAEAKRSLTSLSEEAAKLAAEVEAWRVDIGAAADSDGINALLPRAEKLAPAVKAQVRALLLDRVRTLGLVLDKATKQYAPAAVEAAA